MAIVYRYTDKDDQKIKYVGIVWSDKKGLKDRIREHEKEEKFRGVDWKIEYMTVETRTDAECLEAHFIALYETYKYLNSSKSAWGLCSFARDDCKWLEYGKPVERDSTSRLIEVFIKAIRGTELHEYLINKH